MPTPSRHHDGANTCIPRHPYGGPHRWDLGFPRGSDSVRPFCTGGNRKSRSSPEGGVCDSVWDLHPLRLRAAGAHRLYPSALFWDGSQARHLLLGCSRSWLPINSVQTFKKKQRNHTWGRRHCPESSRKTHHTPKRHHANRQSRISPQGARTSKGTWT